MVSIILTDEQHEELKQLIILQIRNLKKDVSTFSRNRDEFEEVGNYKAALRCSERLSCLFEKLDNLYNLLYKFYQS